MSDYVIVLCSPYNQTTEIEHTNGYWNKSAQRKTGQDPSPSITQLFDKFVYFNNVITVFE